MGDRIIRVAACVGVILFIPVFGNIYVEGWNWDLFDFVIAGTLLFIVGMAIDFAARSIKSPRRKVAAILLIVLVFLAIWTELAVEAVSRIFVSLL